VKAVKGGKRDWARERKGELVLEGVLSERGALSSDRNAN
jgi:hypothetical protein